MVAPVPWFPSVLAPFSTRYAPFSRVPAEEQRANLEVLHPRYPVLPKIGIALTPFLLFARTLPVLRRLRDDAGGFDLIDAHYFYPDGVAAVWLGRVLRKPVVITARGTDINLIPRHPLPRAMIRYAARKAHGIIAVSQALKDALIALGLPGERVRVLRNGVDLEMFSPRERTLARSQLGVAGPTLLSVGHLIERKGHDLVISALTSLPDFQLMIAGEGPEDGALRRLAIELGVIDRVKFLGRVAHERLAEIYSAADALVLASSREGWPNVLLEAMACGTPVVASNVWGNPEVVRGAASGVLIGERTSVGVAAAVRTLFAELPDRAETRRYAQGFSWDDTTQGQIELFAEILGSPG